MLVPMTLSTSHRLCSRSYNACIDDTPNIGAVSSDCRLIKDNWYTSDPASGDVMVDDQRTFNRLDTRRWLWLLNRCANDPEGC